MSNIIDQSKAFQKRRNKATHGLGGNEGGLNKEQKKSEGLNTHTGERTQLGKTGHRWTESD